ncbi:MAG: hypothetical protein LC131_15530 [Anaerolineae bacterium]|nr:hypothetical protein [Anaerolineae bacterium]
MSEVKSKNVEEKLELHTAKSLSVEPLKISPAEPLFRKGVYLALQQLGNVERGKALGLLPVDLNDYELVDDPSGIRLSYAAGRLLHGILAIYESTGTNEGGSYRGHFTSYEETEDRRTGKLTQVRTPGLYVTEPELLDAYGASKVAGGRYSKAHRKLVKDALWEIALTKQNIYYLRKERSGKGVKRPTVKITAPLLSVQQVEYFEDIAEAREGSDPRATWYKIEPLSLVVDRLVSFHIRSHVALYAQIDDVLEEIRGTRRGRKGEYHARFIEHVQSVNFPEHKIGLKILATKIRLGYMAEQRRYSDMRRAVEEAGEVAYRLGYLLEPMVIAGPKDQPMCYLKPNPAQTRAKAPKALGAGGG